MVSVNKAVIARFIVGKKKFEILVDPDRALNFKLYGRGDMESILAIPTIFRDAKKGEKTAESDVEKVFGTLDVYKVAEKIIKKGELQLTTEQRRKLTEQKKKQIVAIIAERSIDPKTGAPHTPARIEAAIERVGVKIDPFKDAEEQVNDVIKAIRHVLPISLETRKIALKIPAEHYGKCYGIITKYAQIEKEEWQKSHYYCLVSSPAGLQEKLLNKLNKISKDIQAKILKGGA